MKGEDCKGKGKRTAGDAAEAAARAVPEESPGAGTSDSVMNQTKAMCDALASIKLLLNPEGLDDKKLQERFPAASPIMQRLWDCGKGHTFDSNVEAVLTLVGFVPTENKAGSFNREYSVELSFGVQSSRCGKCGKCNVMRKAQLAGTSRGVMRMRCMDSRVVSVRV